VPEQVLALLDNLFFSARINDAVITAKGETTFARKPEQALDLARTLKPKLVIIDLDADACSPIELINKIKSDPKLRAIKTFGFVSHVNSQRQAEARDAGCDRVMARSVFFSDLKELVNEVIKL
jgi:CheY-like chemotaxis protein